MYSTIPTFLNQYNYLELRELCQTNKEFAGVCTDNHILREMIFDRNPEIIKLNIRLDFDFVVVFKELVALIDDIIRTEYYPFPRWVNIELFVRDYRQIIYKKICGGFVHDIENNGELHNNVFLFMPATVLDPNHYIEYIERYHREFKMPKHLMLYMSYALHYILENLTIISHKEIANLVYSMLLYL